MNEPGTRQAEIILPQQQEMERKFTNCEVLYRNKFIDTKTYFDKDLDYENNFASYSDNMMQLTLIFTRYQIL